MKEPLDIIDGKRVLISDEIAKCYELGEKLEELNNLLRNDVIRSEEFERRRKKLLWEYDTHTIRLHRKLLAIEGK